MQCYSPRCAIAFHIECARRANYCMEIERRTADPKDQAQSGPQSTNRGGGSGCEKTFRVFCEKHRPLKIVKEMEERDH